MPKARQKLEKKEQQQSLLDMRRRKIALFIQQVEKEAQDHLNELESKLGAMLVEVDKVFNVEVMKLPPLLQDTLICGLISEDEVPASDISIAVKCDTRQKFQPPRGVPSKKKSVDSPQAGVKRSSSKTRKGGKRTKKTPTLAGSNSAGNLTPSASLRRVQSCLNHNPPEQMAANQANRKLRAVMSANDLHCSMTGSSAHVTVTTARGEMVSFSEETKDNINWDLLDDVALCQIQKLSRLMDYLTQQSHCQR